MQVVWVQFYFLLTIIKDDKTMAMLEIIHQYDQAISPLKTKDEITEEVSNKIKNYAQNLH